MRSEDMPSKFLSRGLTIFIVVLSLVVQTEAQNSTVTDSSTSPMATPVASSLPEPIQPITPFPTPVVAAVTVSTTNAQPTTPDDTPIETCCYIESACHKCKNLYKVNSITYCCPNCQGLVLVTDLRCRCYSQGLSNVTLNCTKSKEVVGGYIPLRPSYYTTGSYAIKASAVFSFGMVAIVTVFKDKRTV